MRIVSIVGVHLVIAMFIVACGDLRDSEGDITSKLESELSEDMMSSLDSDPGNSIPLDFPKEVSDDLEAVDGSGSVVTSLDFSYINPGNSRLRRVALQSKSGKTAKNIRTFFSHGSFVYQASAEGLREYPGAKGDCSQEIKNRCALAIEFNPIKILPLDIHPTSRNLWHRGKVQILYNIDDDLKTRLFELNLEGFSPTPADLLVSNYYPYAYFRNNIFPSLAGNEVHLLRTHTETISTHEIQITRTSALANPTLKWTISGEGFSILNSRKKRPDECKEDSFSAGPSPSNCIIRIETNTRKLQGTFSGILKLNFFDGYSNTEKFFPIHGFSEIEDLRDSLLIVYNHKGFPDICNSASCRVLDAYLGGRPGLGKDFPNVLGVNYAFNPSNPNAEVPAQLIAPQLIDPIAEWIQKNDKVGKILYIVLMPEIHFRTERKLSDQETSPELAGSSIGYRLRSALIQKKLIRIDGGLVMHLDMGSEEATMAYIAKLAFAARESNRLQDKRLTISGKAAGISGTTYYILDDGLAQFKNTIYSGYQEYLNLLSLPGFQNSKVYYSNEIFSQSKPAPAFENPSGFQTWGANAGFAHITSPNYMLDGTFTFSGNASWYILKSFESFNGFGGMDFWQGNFTKWFSSNAFGGKSFSHTPIGAVVHVNEPMTIGVNHNDYFSCWERGEPFALCAWSTARTPYFGALGDPLVVK